MNSHLFLKPKQLYTYTSILFETSSLISEIRRDDILIVIAETGAWLLEEGIAHNIARSRAKIFLIVADLSLKKQLEKAYNANLIRIRQMPAWWTHNKHMTIIARDKKPIYAIYFRRRLRSLTICPVFLEKEDTEAIFETFMAYWRKLHWYENRPRILRNDFLSTENMIEEILSEFKIE